MARLDEEREKGLRKDKREDNTKEINEYKVKNEDLQNKITEVEEWDVKIKIRGTRSNWGILKPI